STDFLSVGAPGVRARLRCSSPLTSPQNAKRSSGIPLDLFDAAERLAFQSPASCRSLPGRTSARPTSCRSALQVFALAFGVQVLRQKKKPDSHLRWISGFFAAERT